MKPETDALVLTAGFLRPEQVALELGVRRSAVLSWVRSGELPAVKLGRLVLVPQDALRLAVERRESFDARQP